MKRILLFMVVLILLNCELKVRDTNAQSSSRFTYLSEGKYESSVISFEKEGIEYLVFQHEGNLSGGAGLSRMYCWPTM